jgi:hypothetical protein
MCIRDRAAAEAEAGIEHAAPTVEVEAPAAEEPAQVS